MPGTPGVSTRIHGLPSAEVSRSLATIAPFQIAEAACVPSSNGWPTMTTSRPGSSLLDELGAKLWESGRRKRGPSVNWMSARSTPRSRSPSIHVGPSAS